MCWEVNSLPLLTILTGKQISYLNFPKGSADVYCEWFLKVWFVFDQNQEGMRLKIPSDLSVQYPFGSLASPGFHGGYGLQCRKQRVRNSFASHTAKRLGKSHLFFFCHYQYRPLSKSPLTALNQLTGISMRRHCYNCAIIVGFSLYWIAWPWLRWKAFQSVVCLASNRRGRWIRAL